MSDNTTDSTLAKLIFAVCAGFIAFFAIRLANRLMIEVGGLISRVFRRK